MDKRLKRYYTRTMYRGRGAVARAFDFAASRTIIFLVGTIFIGGKLRVLWQGAFIALFLTAAVSIIMYIYRERKLVRFIAKKNADLCLAYQAERLMLLKEEDFSAVAVSYMEARGYTVSRVGKSSFIAHCAGHSVLMVVLQDHPSQKIEPKDVLTIYRAAAACSAEQVMIAATSELSSDAREFTSKLSIDFRAMRIESLIRIGMESGLLPTRKEAEQEVKKAILQEHISTEKIKRRALYSGRTKAYALSGLLLIVASRITGFNVYYPIVAGLCFLMAIVSYSMTRNTADQS